MGLAAERAAEWRLVLAEAGSNAYENARQEARGMPVRFDVRCCPTAVEAVVTDRTAGFEWPAEAQLPPPDALRGRGLYLIRQLTDEARYERGEETNRLVLVRRGGPAMGCGDGWRESGL
jgi:anti-sigma regulatory factor (Ser/Thr protein kinase)